MQTIPLINKDQANELQDLRNQTVLKQPPGLAFAIAWMPFWSIGFVMLLNNEMTSTSLRQEMSLTGNTNTVSQYQYWRV